MSGQQISQTDIKLAQVMRNIIHQQDAKKVDILIAESLVEYCLDRTHDLLDGSTGIDKPDDFCTYDAADGEGSGRCLVFTD